MGRTLCIITGASRGFGRSIAIRFSGSVLVAQPTDVVLVARSEEGLLETKKAIDQLGKTDHIKVSTYKIDFSSPGMNSATENLFDTFRDKKYSKAFLFNNAGSMGKLSRFSALKYPEIAETIHSNVVAPFALTTKFLRFFDAIPCTIVNVSSLGAIEPFDCWSMYCTSKAAGDMMHKAIALEESLIGKEKHVNSEPRIRVMNYAPGPLDTKMQEYIRTQMPAVDTREVYQRMHEEKNLVDPNISAQVLMDLLVADTYENGAHIDYYDLKNAGLV